MDFNWTTVAVALLNVLVGGVLVALIKSREGVKRVDNEREANLLTERAGEMREMRERIDKLENQLERKDRTHEAELRSYIHRVNNLSQCLDSLLMLLKRGVPVEEAVETVERMRAEQLQRENVERTTIRAAAIVAVSPEHEA